MMVSLDGYFEASGHDLSWHNVDEEFNSFAVEQAQEADTILLGRRTYQLMESFWPSKEGREDDPVIAKWMNETAKVVVSNSLESVTETKDWKHVRLLKDNVAEEIAKLKNEKGGNIALLGSNILAVHLMEAGLIDEFRIMINPVVIGKGTLLFAGIKQKKDFKLLKTRTFGNGNVLVTYQ